MASEDVAGDGSNLALRRATGREGSTAWPAQGERQESGKDGRSLPSGSGRISLSLLLLAGTSQAALADDLLLPFAETASDLLGLLRRFDLHNAVYFGLFMGLVAFSTTTSLLLMRERRRAGASASAGSATNSRPCAAPTTSPPC